MLEKLFHLTENKTTVRTEIIAGLTTFLAMAYILAVNPSILSAAGMDVASVFLATALSAAVASIIMGLVANYPVALAAGMGVNALFAYTVCGQMGYSWSAALAGVFVSGVIFIVISVTSIRKMIINAIPVQMKVAIGAGIGFFIAFVGLKNAAIVVASESTFVSLGNFSDPTVLLALFGILVTLLLVIKKVPAGVFVGMVITAVVGIIAGMVFHIEGMPTLPQGSFITTDFHMEGAGAFLNGFNELFADPSKTIVMIFSFLFVDFFDTAGTLVAIGNKIGLVNPETGELKNAERALLADAVGTVFGAAIGTSTVTSFVESSSGVGVGGRTGLTAVTAGVLFILSIFISPLIISAITNAVTAPALVVVGVMMAQQLKGIDWDDLMIASAAFLTVLVMVLGYSISNGIAIGFVVYTVGMIGAGKAKDIHPSVWILDVIFLIYFWVTFA
ncbi:MAG: NCS2 family permease [Merdibacter sp.]|nr:NCS2 family permease [Merdibacter sp.]